MKRKERRLSHIQHVHQILQSICYCIIASPCQARNEQNAKGSLAMRKESNEFTIDNNLFSCYLTLNNLCIERRMEVES